jgi:hypothetical protein
LLDFTTHEVVPIFTSVDIAGPKSASGTRSPYPAGNALIALAVPLEMKADMRTAPPMKTLRIVFCFGISTP